MKKIHEKHFDTLAEYIHNEYTRRKRDRGPLEKQWEEIDRQLRMEPDRSHKLDANGNVDSEKAWLPEMELPLQAQTLEMLVADSRRMRSPEIGPWFGAHAVVTDKYLEEVDFDSIISGDENDVPSQLTQDNIDKLVIGTLMHWQRQYNFQDNVDMIDAEAFKYGLGIGRARLATKSVFMHTAKGVTRQEQKIPVLFPVSIKNTYPDDRAHIMMNEGLMMGPVDITYKPMLLEDLKAAAAKGSNDPEKEEGGWMPKMLKNVEGKKDGTVMVVEAEGDFVIPRSADSLVLRNYYVSIVIGESNPKVFRLRRRKKPYSSLIQFPYHKEHMDTPYAASPLMKGRPIQIAAVDALNKLGMVSALHAQPPVKYDKDNIDYASSGGPLVHPGAQWSDDVATEQIGDPSALFQLYVGYLQQYSDVTGINSPRLGAQTKSHTTAFAKEAEISQGTVRTVDYVRSSLAGPLAKWLTIAYDIGRDAMTKDTIYIDGYQSFVDIGKKHLPEKVMFEAFGSGGPAEENAKKQARMQALASAMQVDQMTVQLGGQPELDLRSIKEQMLREGGWTDIEPFFRAEGISEVPEGGPAMGATPGLITQNPNEV